MPFLQSHTWLLCGTVHPVARNRTFLLNNLWVSMVSQPFVRWELMILWQQAFPNPLCLLFQSPFSWKGSSVSNSTKNFF